MSGTVRYRVLATDYDGTLATNGVVEPVTLAALERLLASGRRLILVTGRELGDLRTAFERLDLFELVVAENGALLYRPATQALTRLADPPPAAFVADLERAGVGPLSVGEVIVATWEPHSEAVLAAIHRHGLELQVIFNKGAVMVLPTGVNKASGLKAALRDLKLSPHNVVGVGDAENDHSFLHLCELSAAVANALPALKAAATFTTTADHGAGVAEIVEALLENDLRGHPPNLERLGLTFATSEGREVALDPWSGCVLICGASASGKSTVAKRIVESLREHAYQFCIVDPEGDYDGVENTVVVGQPTAPPLLEEAIQLLEDVPVNGVVCMTGIPISDRPAFFVELFSELLAMRARYGRPHWLVLDEAHHLMPAEWQPPNALLPATLENVLLVTVHPELLSREVLERVTDVIAVGTTACDVLARFAEIRGLDIPAATAPNEPGQALLWSAREQSCRLVRVHRPGTEQRRHTRKYAEGNLAPDRSFYFRGPNGELNLRAHNLLQFLELAEGVDDATWGFHLRSGDYSRWFRDSIKDEELAAEAARLEQANDQERSVQLAALRAAVERRYMLSATPKAPVSGAH